MKDTYVLAPAIEILPSRSGLKMLHGLSSLAKILPEIVFIIPNPLSMDNLFKDPLVK